MKIDKNIIKELTDYLNEFNLTEIEYTEKDTKIKVSKSNPTSSNQAVNVAASTQVLDAAKSSVISGTEVKSPIIGTCLLYTSPSPRDLSTSRMPSSA